MALHITEACTGCGACRKICPTHAAEGTAGIKHTIDSGRCIECGACGRVCPAGSVADVYGNPIARVPRDIWMVPYFQASACKACGSCIECCPAGVLAMGQQEQTRTAVLAQPDGCVSCYWCVNTCMFDAVDMREKGADAQ